MTIESWLADAASTLKDADIQSAELDAVILLEEILGKDRAWVRAHTEATIGPYELKSLTELLQKRAQRVPLAYLIGFREFYGLQFRVDETVLVPRPETETLVTYAAEHLPQKTRVLEIGTGSGAIAVALKHAREDLSITATDVSQLALNVAETNAAENGMQITFIESDLFSAVDGRFNCILANLPYVPIEARRQPEIEHEPDLALYGGSDGLDYYRTFLQSLKKHLRDNESVAIVEFSPTQYAAMRTISSKHGFAIEPLSEYIYLLTFDKKTES